ncbi:hypothetical protein F2Q68_00020595 [Brassica cretica]|uniref:Uncharacterized protein n=2 Tax=Brassica cretica TaxID=69181 RepID=A0ABQ7CUC0_BRACR|nr:hypothetical protein F2Q68_00020595 [Brassica cretica]KAF3562620.1 hypothetical protein DY000_02014220 [Brassica cretica]
MNCWEFAGTNLWVNPLILVKEEDNGRPRKKARIEAPKEARWEIKLLEDRMADVEKKVGIIKKSDCI